jgi:inosine-uridine nucleoside N-ribohydrolase
VQPTLSSLDAADFMLDAVRRRRAADIGALGPLTNVAWPSSVFPEAWPALASVVVMGARSTCRAT